MPKNPRRSEGSRTSRAPSVRFAFFGAPALAALFLDQLEAAGLVPSIVVTTPDRPQGRSMQTAPPPVKRWAVSRGIPLLQPKTFADRDAAALRERAPDLFIVMYYGTILPRAILGIPARGALNIHFSLLPRWRDTSPVRAAIMNDDRQLGVSIILLDEKIDHGPIVAQKKLGLESLGGWPPRALDAERLATLESAKLLVEILPSWLEGSIEAQPQNHDVATHCPNYAKKDGLLDLSAGAYGNLLKIRGFDATVGTHAFFERNGKTLRVQILEARLGARGALAIDRVKPEGKREMSYAAFLRSGARPA